MSIRQTLLASFFLIILLAGVQGLMSMRALSEVGSLVTRMYEQPLTGISYARSAQTNFAESMRHMMKAVSLSQDFGSQADREPLDRAFTAFIDDIGVAAERIPGEGIAAQVAAVLAAARSWKAEGDKLLGGSPDGQPITAIPTPTVLENEGERIYAELGLIVEEAAAAGYAFNMEAEEVVSRDIQLMIAILGAVVAVSLVLALGISYRLIGRIKLAMVAAKRVSEGDLDNAVEVRGKDECGQLLQALSVMQATLRERREADRHDAAAKESERIAADRKRTELEARIAEFEREVAEVMEPVRAAISQMQSMSDRVVELSRNTVGKTGHAADTTQEASGNVRSVASAADDLANSIAEISKRVGDAGRSANEAVSEAERTNATVNGLTEATKRIGDIVGLIQDIAAQTNLLALNATIEAARAGEAGKGFAVVATEVKNLADQTAKATEEIATQIATMRNASGEVTSAISEIGTTILRINEQTTSVNAAVEQQTSATSKIARDIQLAATGTEEVSRTIGTVSEFVGESGRMADSLAEVLTSVSDRSQDLVLSIETFLTRIRAA